MNEDIRRVEQDNVLTIVFNRDSKLNALTDHMIDECVARLRTSAIGPTCRSW